MKRQVKSEPKPNLDPDARCPECDALLGIGTTRCWACMAREPRVESVDTLSWICLGVAVTSAIVAVVIALSQ